MRLIDADGLKEWITAHCDIELEPVIEELVLRVIDDQPTAYSTGEVVNQLKEHFNATENKDARLAYHHAINIVEGSVVYE